ncbi:MAG: sigma-70 family RNA polymerase sigma factor [Porticoccaceae bacterium]|nr:sigma-70 family RNA polymerase sigma factor [Porticoccaceae bacterium]
MPTVDTDAHRILDAMYIDHHGWLLNWLCKKLRCPHQAADMAQDTFVRLFSFSGVRNVEEPRALLVTTASRLMIDAARRRKIEQAYLETHAFHQGEVMAAPSAEELALISETLIVIARMLEGLPRICREAFLMNRLDGMKHGEIANRLDVSKSSIKKYIATAMLHCHRIVQTEGH